MSVNSTQSIEDEALKKTYPVCRSHLSGKQWEKLCHSFHESCINTASAWSAAGFPEFITETSTPSGLPPYLAEIASVERALFEVEHDPVAIPDDVDILTLNPTLVGIELNWRLHDICNRPHSVKQIPEMGNELVLVWRIPGSRKSRIIEATENEILAMKMALEGLSCEEVAHIGSVPVVQIKRILKSAARKGIVILPSSRLRRDGDCFTGKKHVPERFLSTKNFTLQWHLTNACEFHCKHCYDRTLPSPLSMKQAQRILADFIAFCKNRRVWGTVCLTGGNPLLFNGFMELYRAIAETDFEISILGNPIDQEQLASLVEIRNPVYYQVSLEGLQDHNDSIRGQGHFKKVMNFLSRLRETGVYSTVMLTLTKANINQVLPLANYLRDRVNRFNFNRLSEFGEGANLDSPSKEAFFNFLIRYQQAAKSNPILKFKDNLFNILQYQSGNPFFQGCTGHGCGAAFNFIAVLPNGEAHACRKLPSPIGNILSEGIGPIYDSEAAKCYRQGSKACSSCPIRPACGGCLAVTAGQHFNPLKERDPYCFFGEQKYLQKTSSG